MRVWKKILMKTTVYLALKGNKIMKALKIHKMRTKTTMASLVKKNI